MNYVESGNVVGFPVAGWSGWVSCYFFPSAERTAITYFLVEGVFSGAAIRM